ncbi:RND efflux system outer membrane lipoprotein NodT [Erythrobacter sp. NAP1]|uniref:efflux transporter outer membrane subunit n=1 Tax=Erythrobacter sp. NAP1 TaxID=237727 RepID=UPI000068514B|nr:efflux transporter outer membrane subunit [Erythrobacter sp. NAP1]EAQ27669.1 RND efflux system outer membrane lipoprotein NodT [Erythrobacter sp. NAP1]
MQKTRERRFAAVAAAPAILALALLQGCSLPGTAQPPTLQETIPLPERWTFASQEGQAIELGEYWALLNDPLIDEFVTQARTQNYDIAQSLAQLRAAEAGLREARAARLPSASAGGGVGRDFGDFSRDEFQFSLSADLAWELDLFGRISSSIDASRADLAAAGFNAADLERIVVATVAIQTITARSVAAQLEFARQSLANQDDNLQIARWRNQAGLVSSLDVEQARTQRAQTAATIPLLEGDLVAAANAISTLIGDPPGEVYARLLADPREVPSPPLANAVNAPADILRMRPDVSAAEARLVGDFERIGIARTQLYPIARLTGTVGTSSFGIDDLFDVITGNVFASLSQLLFDGGAARARVDASRAIADGSLAAWRQSILTALEDVETASVDLDTSNERVIALVEASDGARNAAILGRSQYQAGLIDFQVLLNVESALLSAETSQISAEAARAIAFVQLARAMGGGWRSPPEQNSQDRDNGQ